MAGILLNPVQVDSKSGVLTLFHALSNDVWSPTFEVTYKPYCLVAYGLTGAQKVVLYNVVHLPTGTRYSPFTYNGNTIELTPENPTALVALTGVYGLVLAGGGLKTVIVKAIPQQIIADNPSPTKAGVVNSMVLPAAGYSDILQVYNRAHTIIGYDLGPGDTIQVFATIDGLVAPYAVNGEPLVLDEDNTTAILDKTGDYTFLASKEVVLGINPNYISFANPYILKGDKGDPGPTGSAAGYTHNQVTPSDTWTINHNLGFKPAVELLTVGGAEFEATVLHTSINQTVVYLATPIAGSARLN